jgi:lipopolysaccharide export system permease protein
VRTLDRYLAITFLRNFIPAWFGLVSLFFLQAMIAELLEQPYPASQILWRGVLGLPVIFLQMAPPAVLAGTVMTLSGFSRTGELTAFFAVGFGKARIIATLGAVVFMLCCLLLVFQDRIAPLFVKKRTTYFWHVMKNRPDFFLDVKRDKIWYRSKNLIFNLRSFDSASRTIHGMSVYTLDEGFQLVQLVEARKGVHTRSGWQLQDGTVTVFESGNAFPLTQKFDRKELLIAETPKDFQEIEKEVDTLRLRELSAYIDRIRAAGTNTRAFEVKFHSRIAVCFIPLIMCWLGVPFSMGNRRSGGVARDLGLALLVTFFYWLFYSISLSLGLNGALHPWLAAWLPSMIFLAVLVALAARKTA